MARNPKNEAACSVLAVAISRIKHRGAVTLRDATPLIAAYAALLQEPEPCLDNCIHAKLQNYRKCNHCARRYKQLPDNYEVG